MPLWLRLRRLRAPAFLLLFGITALLNQWSILRFSRSWPLYLILAGLFGIAERTALSSLPLPAYPAYAGAYPAGAYPASYVPAGSGMVSPGVGSDHGAPALSSSTSPAVPGALDPERRS